MSATDLSEFQSEWVEPVSTDYRGWSVYELPPNGQGIATLEMLNIMERFPVGSFGPLSPEAFHAKMEAQKLAYEDLRRYVADLRFAKVPVKGLLSKEYAKQRAGLIDPQKARCDFAAGTPPEGDTIYMSAIDKDGNVVVKASSEGRAEAALGVLMEKLAKRGVPLEGLDPQKVEPAAGGTVRQLVRLKKGLKQDDAKKIVALVKETGLKVQAAIQGEAVRISAKKRDDLQACMQKIRGAALGVPLQFQNFRE
jgi:uncharacterized protein YajQ (UPF0234 family)